MDEKIRQISDDKKKDIIGNFLLFLMFFCEVVYLYSASSATLIVCAIPGILTFLYIKKNDGYLLPFLAGIAASIIVLISINRLFVLNCSWRGCLRMVFISLPIAYLLYNVHINRYVALLFFYVVFLYTVVSIIFADPVELYRIFRASSRNYISVLLIACLFPYYLACERDNVEVSIVPALLSLPVSIYVQSRGGMIASGILVALSFVRELFLGFVKKSFKNRKKLISFFIQSGILVCIALFTFCDFGSDQSNINDSNLSSSASADSNIDDSSNYLSRFTEAEEYPITRLDMWKEYITVTGTSINNIILGPPLTTCPLILEEAYNSHNSYFMTHSYMGIVGFLGVMVGGIGCIILCKKKKEYNLLFLSITFLVRAMTDYLFPMLFCDCIILFMILKVGIEIMGEVYGQKE